MVVPANHEPDPPEIRIVHDKLGALGDSTQAMFVHGQVGLAIPGDQLAAAVDEHRGIVPDVTIALGNAGGRCRCCGGWRVYAIAFSSGGGEITRW